MPADFEEFELPPYMIPTPTGSVVHPLTPAGQHPSVLRLFEILPNDAGLPWPSALAHHGGATAQVAPPDSEEVGNPSCPTRGSALHRWGTCKPCAFTYKEGCKSGVECQFCHLCDPGERRRRKKERMVSKRQAMGQLANLEEARRHREVALNNLVMGQHGFVGAR